MRTGAPTVLLVEDEAVIALDTEQMLNDLGYRVLGPAFTLADGLEHARHGEFDVALLDVNLSHGTTSAAIAEVLRARAAPFAFVTGYGMATPRKELPEAPILAKPVRRAELKTLLHSLLGSIA